MALEPSHLQRLLAGADCLKCNLRQADLSGANLAGRDLGGAFLSGANL
ncbi:MAG: pentapeptide repeat-containing protein, partial [Gammaproteobacteria bacterium]|nr:pentapeptide repeat-containing protein [Gammaproteobacteria bacterium]